MAAIDLAARERMDPALLRAVRECTLDGRYFALRSGPIRADVDRLAILNRDSPQGVFSSEGIAMYERLSLALNAAVSVGESVDSAAWSRAGFDCSCVFTDRLPWMTTGWTGPGQNGAWSEATQLSNLFDASISDSLGSKKCVLRPLEEDHSLKIQDALSVLAGASNMVMHDFVRMVRHLCLFDFDGWQSLDIHQHREMVGSASTNRIPGTCLLSPSSFETTDVLAEALYHEALHNKLTNIIQTRDIFRRDAVDGNDEHFYSDWNRETPFNSCHWDFDRSLHAYYVYVHLTAFYEALIVGSGRAEYREFQKEVCRIRGSAIGSWLQTVGSSRLGEDGRALVSLLDGALASIT